MPGHADALAHPLKRLASDRAIVAASAGTVEVVLVAAIVLMVVAAARL